MNPIDGVGNILNEKDVVAMHIDATVTGVVAKIKEASVVMAKANEELPGFITINVVITVPYSVQMARLTNIHKIVKPPGWDKPQA
jgi:hypothetical protein